MSYFLGRAILIGVFITLKIPLASAHSNRKIVTICIFFLHLGADISCIRFMKISQLFGLCFVWLLVSPLYSNAQEKKSFRSSHADTISSMHVDSAIAYERDVKDIYRKLFHIKLLGIEVDSVTSVPIFSFIPAVGYTLQSRLALILSGNIAFRLDPLSRISTITASTAYTQNKQFTVPIESNIWTNNNQYNFVGDYRFYKYPQSTFGLGSNSNIANEDPMDYSFLR